MKSVIIESLANSYNEVYWKNFADAFSDDTGNNDMGMLDTFNIPEDIKIVLIKKMGNYAKEWLSKTIPALDNYKPIELAKTDEGIKALKMALLSMPD